MKVEVEYWNPKNESKVTESGFLYLEIKSVVTDTQNWEGSEDELFMKIYKLNNSLRYCNGSYYKFKDVKVDELYKANYAKYNTFENYYGNGVVD